MLYSPQELSRIPFYLSQHSNILGSNLFSAGKGDFDDAGAGDEESWALAGNNTMTTEDLGGGNYALKITYVDNDTGAFLNLWSGADLSVDLVAGSTYMMTMKTKVSGGNAHVDIDTYDGSAYQERYTETSGTLTFHEFSFTLLSGVFSILRFDDMGAGEIIWIDDITIQEVTSR